MFDGLPGNTWKTDEAFSGKLKLVRYRRRSIFFSKTVSLQAVFTSGARSTPLFWSYDYSLIPQFLPHL